MYIGKKSNYTQKIKSRQKHKKSIRGGKVIGSGGFGCIFNPALECLGADETKPQNSITKLMKKKYAINEYKEVAQYLHQLKKIPNYENYFLVNNFTLCDPKPLTSSDLEDFDKKCKALTKNGFTKKNVNSKLGKLKAITMPYGGVDVYDYVEASHMNYSKLRMLNRHLHELFIHGILPMNQEGVYHCDIKDSNILVETINDVEIQTRLIDWGLSTSIVTKTQRPGTTNKKIPKILLDRPFQFNVPFSNVIFNSLFTEMYSKFLHENQNPTYIEIRSFVINYTIAWVNERGMGHLKSLNSIFHELFDKTLTNVDKELRDDIIEFEYTFYFIFEYLSKILQYFTKDGHFDRIGYFNQVFLKNIDIWGFVMVYVAVFEYLHDHYKDLRKIDFQIMDTIKDMILYLFECSIQPLDKTVIESHLDTVDKLLETASLEKKSKAAYLASRASETRSRSRSRSRSHTHTTTQKSKTISEPKKIVSDLQADTDTVLKGGSIIEFFEDAKKKGINTKSKSISRKSLPQ